MRFWSKEIIFLLIVVTLLTAHSFINQHYYTEVDATLVEVYDRNKNEEVIGYTARGDKVYNNHPSFLRYLLTYEHTLNGIKYTYQEPSYTIRETKTLRIRKHSND